MPRYDPARIEPRWQAYWDENQTFRTGPFEEGRDKIYVLDMFPYPSGDGLHVGHPEGYTATDIVCRYQRMQGTQVLHPMGWDAFGLPAEQHAIKTGTHPRETTYRNIDTFRRQLKMLGFSYDWDREFSTTDPDYYRWTQWIFLQLFDTWYDQECQWTGPDGLDRVGRGRPISELPIPDNVSAEGPEAVRRYQDRHRLAYQHEAPVNWCPELGTVLANEEVIDGKSERGEHPVERLPLRQWMLAITRYAERLLDELDLVNWPESIKLLQRNWIGRSTGAEVDFFIGSAGDNSLEAGFADWQAARADTGLPEDPTDDVLRVYTTRPDTLFGATYMVIAPEHPCVDRLTTADQSDAVTAYQAQAAAKSDLDRTDLAKTKTGVFTGSDAINPANGQRIPIWVADYVLISYGTGAIMAVPGQDERDWEFAEVFDLPIVRTVQPPEDFDGKAYPGDGPAINSEFLDGLDIDAAKQRIIQHLSTTGQGDSALNYKLRDWLFSRQHFWGEPFPIWHELDDEGNLTGLMQADDPASLPAELPENFEFKPHGRPDPPLEEAPEDWLYRTDEAGTRLKRETNSMPQWAGSCWYYLRFADPKNHDRFIDTEAEKNWLPVDLYIGGAEHAVLHLLYSRFWHKVLFDRGHVCTPEPFKRLVNQGMILGEAELAGYRDTSGTWVSAHDVDPRTFDGEKVSLTAEEVQKQGEDFVLVEQPGIVVEGRAFKMSKSRGNVINPDDIVTEYGADSLRLYEMFMGPLEATKPWSMSGVEGVSRFLGRVWRMIVDERADEVTLHPTISDATPDDDQLRILHRTIKAVTEDIDKLSFNTAISRLMEFTNALGQADPRPRSLMEPFLLLLSPFAPHLAEELWCLLGHDGSLAYEPWPQFDESLLVTSTVEVPVQVNGKLRGKVTVATDADEATIQDAAAADEAVARFLAEKTIVKTIVVPGRLVNFVVK
ncbi:MAG: leucine--tRNA ligase [Planctomycetota bacterium]|nr:leucine--tRNA ligase [Planctomycetota bacterium]MEC9008368.1 leucine--tRNA ligase [Planctomycetota bacterium]